MPKQIEFNGTIHEFADDFTDADIATALQGESAPSSSPSESAAQTVAGALPTVGGMVGGLVGGIPGAALGGAAGRGFGQVVSNASQLPGALADIGRNALSQPAATMRGFLTGAGQGAADAGIAGAIQGASEGAGKLITPLAKGIYAAGMLPLKALRDKYGLRKLVDAGFDHGIMPTAGGAAKAGAAMAESKAAQGAMRAGWDAARPSGLHLPSAVRRGYAPMVQAAEDAERAIGAPRAIRQRINDAGFDVIDKNPERVSAVRLGEMQHIADDIADPAYSAARRAGIEVPRGEPAHIAKGASTGYRQTLNEAIGPQYAAQGQKTKTLYGVKEMAKYRAEAPNALAHQIGGGVALGGVGAATGSGDWTDRALRGATFAAFASPSVRAGAGLALPSVARYGPRAVDLTTGSAGEQALREALLRQLLGAQEGEQ